MDILALIFAVVAFIASQSAKKKKSQQAQRGFEQAAAAKKTVPSGPPYAPAQPKAIPRPAAPAKPTAAAQPLTMPAISFAEVPGQVIMPTVHTHVEPDCETHDAPGSLGTISTEGKDPCHEAQFTRARSAMEETEEDGGLTLEWSGENMVKAFIMQEVLTRPCQRGR